MWLLEHKTALQALLAFHNNQHNQNDSFILTIFSENNDF